ncbi:MAG: SDR family NAD(P)-dependent oxidoreductase [Candidatus Korobacteraceae bacterium]
MENTAYRAIAIVGVGAILPDAPNVPAFWNNVKTGRYSISEVRPDRWDTSFYYDADPAAPDKTYSKIGGWVREYTWDPMKWRLPIPPRVADAMDAGQKWAVACTREALEDYGYPKRPLDLDRTAVILGNAMAGENHYRSSLRVFFPEYAHELTETPAFASLPVALQHDLSREFHDRMARYLANITEDTMPGELANCMAGRVANLYNFHGPNFVCDAACASAMAAISSAAEGLIQNDFDVAVSGGVDRNMGAPTFVKFCKIGALSATGTRPYAEGADGFVMGEGSAIFILKRLADAERDQDKIYAVLRGIGGSSDGKGKGITAPNPIGQKFCIERAWQNAGLSPATATLIEGHGTSTRVGDVVEAQSMVDVLCNTNLPAHSIALGSVKSNIGHLKGAAGAAGMLKAALALHNKVLPPSLHCEHPSPDIDFAHSPLYVNTELQPWTVPGDGPRRVGVSAFGFGGTNFHMVMEEHLPGKLNGNGKHSISVPTTPPAATKEVPMQVSNVVPASATAATTSSAEITNKVPLRGALVIGAASEAALIERLVAVQKSAQAGQAPVPAAPAESDLRAAERLAIDYSDAPDLATKCGIALKAFQASQAAFWKAIRAQGIFRGHGPAPKVAFLYTGQGSQYVNMLRGIRKLEPIVGETFAEADRVMTPMLGKPLSDFVFVDNTDPVALAESEESLRQTEITQPAVLTADIAMTRLLAAYGIQPNMTMGHSMGEYAALVASGGLSFEDGLDAVSARGRGMAQVAVADKGKMAAVFAPIAEVGRILKTIDGYVVIANVNSNTQSVIGGASDAVEQAAQIFLQAGYNVVELSVSHAFHTSIVAGASKPLREMLERLHLQSPLIPIVANVDGEFYPTGADVAPRMIDLLGKQVAAPVQFIKGLRTLYSAGARVFVEVGPKKALQGFAEDVLGSDGEVVSLFTNHPKLDDLTAFNQALCGLYAAGLGRGVAGLSPELPANKASVSAVAPQVDTRKPAAIAEPAIVIPTAVQPAVAAQLPVATIYASAEPERIAPATSTGPSNGGRYAELGRLFAGVLDRSWEIYHGEKPEAAFVPVTITGASLGLPGTERIFDDGNIERILRGDQLIRPIPANFRQAMLDKRIRRLVKSEKGEPTFESITDVADVIKLAGRGGAFDLESEFGVPAEHLAALDRVTRLAIAAGIDALRDAGIPLVMRYKTTTKGTQLPERWGLPDAMRDDTGVIFGSAFPGYDSYAEIISGYFKDRARRDELAMLEKWSARTSNGHSALGQDVAQRIDELRAAIAKEPYVFDRRFLLRVLSMGHSQFAELIGARGPNTQINAACATTAQAVGIAEDWIRAGRCRRVIVISADDVTSDNMIGWFGPGFLASGAAATDEQVEEAAIPFDRRRHGLIMGMGAAALVVESAASARERGIQPICEVLSTATANSAFHGTRLDVQHIGQVMEHLLSQAEARNGVQRQQVAPQMVFVSHETYTPARGGSASAEVHALRHVFGDVADQIVVANTKGLTGHAMATGIEDVLAVKALETGLVPPVANFKEVDPELGPLNLSRGGKYPIAYALHLGAGFGSQISMMLLRWLPTKDGVRRGPNDLGYAYRVADTAVWNAWLSHIAGYPTTELEVVKRTLRVRDQGPWARTATTVEDTRPLAAQTPAPPAPAPKSAPPVQTTAPTATAAAVATAVAPAPPRAETAKPVVVPAPPTPAPFAAVQSGSVKERILALVVEKTGYPEEMLDLELDLEADLGVDTVKQAELFAAIRETYGIPRDENVKLRDYPTLAHVIRFVYEKRPDLAAGPAPPPKVEQPAVVTPVASIVPAAVAVATPPTPLPAAQASSVKDRILALVVEKTGYPEEMLDLELDLEADLGVDTVKQAELFAAIRETYNIPRDENVKLRDYPTLAHVIRFVYEKRPDLAGGSVAAAKVEQPAPPVEGSAPAVAAANTAASVVPLPQVAAVAPDTAVKESVLALVVEKTDYPQDMLDLDLDLEADLGVDTVKQAEMFAAIRELYHIPRDENRKLRDYPTIGHVMRFVYEMRPDLAGGNAQQPPIANQQPAMATESETASSPVSIPTPTLAAPPAISPAATDEAIQARVLEIVAEKTGYPQEMLDLDLDLEADLGIDTVKQAEMFASVRAAYNIPRDENLKLRDFPTLAHVIKFAQQGAAGAKAAHAKAANAIPDVPAATVPSPLLLNFDAANSIPRRVPVPTLRPPLSLCKPTGVTLGRGSRVIIMSDNGGAAKSLAGQLRQKEVEVLSLTGAPDADTLQRTLETWLASGAVQGVYWLPALDNEGPLSGMDAAQWQESLRVRVKSLYLAMRKLYDQVAAAGTFLVSATRLGGQHGYDPAGAFAPMGGAVVGFTKAYKRERPDALVKAVDFPEDRDASELAAILIGETLRDNGAVEIGYKNGLRWTVGLKEQTADDGQPGLVLNQNSVFVITGAAGSIVSAITADLAAASGGTFYLLDLVPEPDANNPDLARFVSDKDSLKRELFARIQARGERATPALVEKELAALERAHAALSAIDAVRAAGGTPHYFSVNLADPNGVAKAIDLVRQKSGRIDVLLHAAGLERSHFLPAKDQREFDLVFDVKADGWFNLLHAIGDMPLGATVAFSSVAGRFGNGGQTDYSAANDLLCKYTSSFRTTRPQTRGIVIDWSAWGDIGMATRGSIPKMMELAGIDMVPPEAAIPVIRRELTAGGRTGEVLIAKRLGSLLNEWDATGGLDTVALAASGKLHGPMIGEITGMGISSGLTMQTTLDPKLEPFLYDHQIDGIPVLPGVMGIEAFAEAALCLHPGWYIESIEEVNFLAPFKFYKDEPRTVMIQAILYAHDDKLIADCRLFGRRKLAGQTEPQETTHFTARVRVSQQTHGEVTGPKPRLSAEGIVDAAHIYRIYFHGPAYQVLEKAWWDGEHIVGELTSHLPDECQASDGPTVIGPRLIELCFQTAGLWEMAAQHRMGLPWQVQDVSWLRAPDLTDHHAYYALVTPHPAEGTFDAEVVDAEGNRYLRLDGYRTAQVPSNVDTEPLQALEDAMSPQPVSS